MKEMTEVSNLIFVNRNWSNIKKTLFHVVTIVLLGGMVSFPSILFGFPSGGHDSFPHLTWFKQFSEQFWAGEVYPKWLINDSAGLGSPVFFYYGPVPYYISSMLSPFFKSDLFGWQQLGLSAVLALIASGITAYLWIRTITNERVALISAFLYMIMPYHLAIDLYERAAFPEFWSFAWMPLILYFENRIKRGDTAAIPGMAISYTLLIMTHLPTTLIFSGIPVAYSMINVRRNFLKKSILFIMIAMMLGVSLSAIYLLPALGTQGYVNIAREGIWTLFMDNYLFTSFTPGNIFMIELNLVVIGMILAAASAAIIYFSSSEVNLSAEIIFWLAVAIVIVFMMTPLSRPLVHLFPLIHRIQFPWRFNTALVLATTAIFGISLASLRKPLARQTLVPFAVSALLITSWAGINIWQGVQETRFERESINERIPKGSFDINIRPKWVQESPRDFAKDLAKVNLVSGSGEAAIRRWEPRDIVFKVNSSDGAVLNIGQLYYPGWTAQIIGQPCCLPLQPSETKGLINLTVPGGVYEVALRLLPGPQEITGRLISAISLVIIAVLAILSIVKEVKSKQVLVTQNPDTYLVLL